MAKRKNGAGKVNSRRPIGIDLFAGAGGLSLGFEQAGFDIVAAVEIDPIHCATHEFNFPYSEIVCKDVKQVEATELRLKAGIGNRDVDVVFGGAPCQGFSMIGKRALEDPRNELVSHFVRLVLELAPKYFVFENVPGLAQGKHKKFLEEMIGKFEDNGYKVVQPYEILYAAEYGVPQDRRRVFLLGAREDMDLPVYPLQTHRHREAKNRHSKQNAKLPLGPSVWDAIGDLPAVESFAQLFDRDWIKAKYGKETEYSRAMRGMASNVKDYSYRRKFDRNLLTSSTRTEHNALSQERFAKAEWGGMEPVSRFHKLDPKGLCNTLRAGTASDRGAFTSPRPIHPHVPRCITVREAARLHSYPDWFRFHVTKWHGFRQIGNSVPPLLARAVAGEIMAAMGAALIVPDEILEMGEEKLLNLNMTEAARRYEVPADTIKPRTRKIDMNEEAEALVG
jgi:DNA (cytosine-5)-methyltransferase 1